MKRGSRKSNSKTKEALDYSQSTFEMVEEWPEEAFFIVALAQDNTAIRKESKEYQSFRQLAENSTISWINCCLKDIKKTSEVANFFGFKESLAKDLLMEKISSYKDSETELGLLLPAVKVRGLEVNISKIIVLVKKNLILVIHDKKVTRFMRFLNYSETFMKNPCSTSISSRHKVCRPIEKFFSITSKKSSGAKFFFGETIVHTLPNL